MNKVLVSALRYSQGPGATAGLATEMLGLGLRGPVCIIASRSAQRELEATWTTVFAAAGMAFVIHPFSGECSRNEIARGRAAAAACGAQVIVGAGGGKALDTGRAVAAELGIPRSAAQPLRQPTRRAAPSPRSTAMKASLKPISFTRTIQT